MTTRGQFAFELLSLLGIEANQGNVCGLVSWMAAEGCNAANNPLATTEGGFGSDSMTEWNSAGVKQYPTLEAGVEATKATLTNGLYGPVLAGLRSGSAGQLAQAVARSPWGTEPFSPVNSGDSAIYDVAIGGGDPSPPPPPPPPSDGGGTSAPASPVGSGAPLLRQGTTGWAVAALQRILDDRANLGLVVDGDFGPLTASAVESWQRTHGLVVDQIAGPQTWTSLLTG